MRPFFLSWQRALLFYFLTLLFKSFFKSCFKGEEKGSSRGCAPDFIVSSAKFFNWRISLSNWKLFKRVLLETSKTPIFNLINVNVNLSQPSHKLMAFWKHLQNWFLTESSPRVWGEINEMENKKVLITLWNSPFRKIFLLRSLCFYVALSDILPSNVEKDK